MIKLKKKPVTVFKGLGRFLAFGGFFSFSFLDFFFLMNEHIFKTLQNLNHFSANSPGPLQRCCSSV